MKNIIYLVFTFSIVFLSSYNCVWASDYIVSTSATTIAIPVYNKVDNRIVILREFLENHRSPLADYSEDLIYYSDLYDLDWRLIPAISGVESTFGKNIPKDSFNAYGWANGNYYFKSWQDSIHTVAKTLREKYYNKGATSISKIARRYAPPSSVWAWKVRFFMNKIEPLPVEFDL